MKPTVSINLCCYNSEKYLRETLQSVINQTYKDWELVIINDGSSDSTESIISGYIKQGYPIIYHYQENKGLGASRNEALKLSNGEYIAFIDHDDIWMPEKLEKQVPLFDDPEVGLVYSDSIIFNDAGHEATNFSRQRYYAGYCFAQLLADYFLDIETVLIRHSILDKIEWFDERFNMIEDTDLFCRIGYRWKLAMINEPLAKWRVHSESWTWKKGHLVAGETDQMLKKFEALFPDFTKNYTEEIEALRIQIAISRARHLWKAQKGMEARRLLLPYIKKHRKPFFLFGLSFLPERLIAPVISKLRKTVTPE